MDGCGLDAGKGETGPSNVARAKKRTRVSCRVRLCDPKREASREQLLSLEVESSMG